MKILHSIVVITLLATATINPASARPQPGPGPRPMHVPRVEPHRSYHRLDLPTAAAMILISGITYAIIDGMYYRRQGDTFVYVDTPPTTQPETKVYGVGSIIYAVPHTGNYSPRSY